MTSDIQALVVRRYFLLLILSVFSSFVSAEEKVPLFRSSYSYLGVELEYFDYSEDLNRFDISTDYKASNMGIQTGGYVAVNDTLGFYITANKTILWETNQEEWLGSSDVLQTNDMIVTAAVTRIHTAYQMTPKHALLMGVNMINIDYDRFNFYITPAGQARGVLNPNGSQGQSDFDLADAIAELQFSVSAAVGYEYNTLFTANNDALFVYQTQLMVGVPLYYRVTNSSVQDKDELSDNFNGYDIFGRFTAGMYLTDYILLAATFEVIHQQRNEVTVTGVTVPETTITQFKPGITLYWSF